jgi:hypothetical protein
MCQAVIAGDAGWPVLVVANGNILEPASTPLALLSGWDETGFEKRARSVLRIFFKCSRRKPILQVTVM